MITSARTPPDVLAYVRDLAAALAVLRSDLVGVYLHGSAVLGGFRSSSSDVDVLAVVAASGTVTSQRTMGEVIATVGGCPGTGLEMSVVTQDTVITTGAGRPGDPDLVLHCAVCRDQALAVAGPPADQVFGPIPRDCILAAMSSELGWALGHASTAYGVLNACRAVRFADDGQLCSKLDGGKWYLARYPHNSVVTAAVNFQRLGRNGPATEAASHFVAEVAAGCEQRRLRPDSPNPARCCRTRPVHRPRRHLRTSALTADPQPGAVSTVRLIARQRRPRGAARSRRGAGESADPPTPLK